MSFEIYTYVDILSWRWDGYATELWKLKMALWTCFLPIVHSSENKSWLLGWLSESICNFELKMIPPIDYWIENLFGRLFWKVLWLSHNLPFFPKQMGSLSSFWFILITFPGKRRGNWFLGFSEGQNPAKLDLMKVLFKGTKRNLIGCQLIITFYF